MRLELALPKSVAVLAALEAQAQTATFDNLASLDELAGGTLEFWVRTRAAALMANTDREDRVEYGTGEMTIAHAGNDERGELVSRTDLKSRLDAVGLPAPVGVVT